MKKLLIASTSTVHGKAYLEYILPELAAFFSNVDEILFIPYAQPSGISYDEYTAIAQRGFAKINIKVKGIHQFENPVEAINNSKGIFTGGGNTFLLLKQLYDNKLISVLKNVVENGTLYFGTSAGSNITGVSIQNTNDMPIIYPPSFDALGFINFNLNPHYLDPDPTSTHMGETRETRINEFHKINSIPVLGLREGSWLEVEEEKILLKGVLNARLFQQNQKPVELPPNTDLSFLN
ncbi:dipeptidase PepE [Lutibacter sp. HS1-25]|uniref:dipeptidase PepE n=1 Tax=Lutibacter sp. HS1-25 TaxID=2485000 RepID=UPI001010EEC6|nr:dipeptidase PepE [Lutibacter sp. HS1-25]RXP44822.1 dipeptidase PepE [Lutibacter sp. HS1-25]